WAQTAVCQQRRGAQSSNGNVRRQILLDACAQGFGRFRIPLPQGFLMKRLKNCGRPSKMPSELLTIRGYSMAEHALISIYPLSPRWT
ncbi:MAG: hypothetical protein MR537_02955, partial [Clostridiales bacterium]|nr:hypothetical protein [Clostridiales bacterium]